MLPIHCISTSITQHMFWSFMHILIAIYMPKMPHIITPYECLTPPALHQPRSHPWYPPRPQLPMPVAVPPGTAGRTPMGSWAGPPCPVHRTPVPRSAGTPASVTGPPWGVDRATSTDPPGSSTGMISVSRACAPAFARAERRRARTAGQLAAAQRGRWRDVGTRSHPSTGPQALDQVGRISRLRRPSCPRAAQRDRSGLGDASGPRRAAGAIVGLIICRLPGPAPGEAVAGWA